MFIRAQKSCRVADKLLEFFWSHAAEQLILSLHCHRHRRCSFLEKTSPFCCRRACLTDQSPAHKQQPVLCFVCVRVRGQAHVVVLADLMCFALTGAPRRLQVPVTLAKNKLLSHCFPQGATQIIENLLLVMSNVRR